MRGLARPAGKRANARAPLEGRAQPLETAVSGARAPRIRGPAGPGSGPWPDPSTARPGILTESDTLRASARGKRAVRAFRPMRASSASALRPTQSQRRRGPQPRRRVVGPGPLGRPLLCSPPRGGCASRAPSWGPVRVPGALARRGAGPDLLITPRPVPGPGRYSVAGTRAFEPARARPRARAASNSRPLPLQLRASLPARRAGKSEPCTRESV